MEQMKMWSPSLYKDFEVCPAEAVAKIKGEWEEGTSEALIAGKYTDCMLVGDANAETWIQENWNALATKKGEKRAFIQKADEAIEQLRRQPIAMHYLQGDHQMELVGEIDGTMWHGFADTIGEDFISDLKLVRDFKAEWDGTPMPFNREYDMQLAVYQELYRQMTGKKLPCYLVMATKEAVPRVCVCQFSQADLDEALASVKAHLPVFQPMLTGEVEPYRCEKCDYCASTVVLEEVIDANDVGI